MDASRAALLNWRLRRGLRSLDWILVAALGLFALDAAYYFYSVAPAVQASDALQAQVAALRATADAADNPPARSDPQAELAAFYAALARPAGVPDQLRRLHRAAAGHGLAVEQGEYRPLPDPGGKLTRYQILLPARGTYPQVRRFLAQAGRELPALALDGVSFQRQQIGDEMLEAQIRFTLFVEGQG